MTIFFRLLETDDKGTALHQAIQQLAQKQPNSNTFAVEPESFQQVPGATFAYWVSEKLLKLFTDLFLFESSRRSVLVGLQTSDDFRFIRTFWECESPDGKPQTFFPLAKGGGFSKFYSDIYLAVNWQTMVRKFHLFQKPILATFVSTFVLG